MKRLIIVCEGPTEKEFCSNMLNDFLLRYDIVTETPLVKHSGGGVVPWPTLRKQIINHLMEGDAFVTMLIDYYGIKDDFEFPKWEEAKAVVDRREKMSLLEQAMLEDIQEELRYRFVPHLQLHEFESLLFSDLSGFEKNFTTNEMKLAQLQAILRQFPNPEDINNGLTTAPSKRLESAITGYKKVLYGNCVALDIGLEKMMAMCPHFREWIDRLSQI